MQPSSREMEEINSLLNTSDLHDLQNPQIQSSNSHFDPNSHDDFIEQMLSAIPSACSWPETAPSDAENVNFHFDDQASRLRQNQIGGGGSPSAAARMLMQQQLAMQMPNLAMNGGGGGGGYFERPQNGSFKSQFQGGEGSVQGSYNGFSGANHAQQFHHPQGQSFNSPAGSGMNQSQASGSTGGAPKQRVRARRGQATDPHSIAERLRRERIAERMKSLQELVPNANKTDKASMLDEIIDYVKFLQLQVKVLSMSRLGGAAAVAPLVADMSSEGGGDCIQSNGSNGPTNRPSNGNQTAPSSEATNMTENQVAKLLEEDMGQAMQYLQGKGLCLMPISLATAISTATCQSRLQSNAGEGPSSPSMSVLTVQSASAGADGASAKDAASQ